MSKYDYTWFYYLLSYTEKYYYKQGLSHLLSSLLYSLFYCSKVHYCLALLLIYIQLQCQRRCLIYIMDSYLNIVTVE